jgi:uncharacterized membrane protein
MDLKTAKLMGGIGAILTLLAVIPSVGWLLSIVGFVLVLLAVKTISDTFKENKIFTNYLVAVVLSIASSLILAIGGVASAFRIIGIILQGFRIGIWRLGGGLAIGVILLLLISWVIFVIGNYFIKSSFDGIGEKTGEKNFKTAGLLLFIGSILLVVFGIGAIVLFVGVIFEIIGFFSMPENLVRQEETKIT